MMGLSPRLAAEARTLRLLSEPIRRNGAHRRQRTTTLGALPQIARQQPILNGNLALLWSDRGRSGGGSAGEGAVRPYPGEIAVAAASGIAGVAGAGSDALRMRVANALSSSSSIV